MRSESARRILEKTPKEVRENVIQQADFFLKKKRFIGSLRSKVRNIKLLKKVIKSIL
jgi:hypothetical protein